MGATAPLPALDVTMPEEVATAEEAATAEEEAGAELAAAALELDATSPCATVKVPD